MADVSINVGEMDTLAKRITLEVLAGVDIALKNKIGPLMEKLSVVTAHVTEVEDRVAGAEARISTMEDTVARDNADLVKMKQLLTK